MKYDVAVVGGGVVGCAILNKLTRKGLNAVLIEKANDVAMGASKANSGIIHAGFDCKPNTLKARFNVRGSQMYPQLCKELNIGIKNCGALVVGNDMAVVKELLARGKQNGVKGLKVLNRNKLLKLVPGLAEDVTCGLYAKTSAIVSPYMVTIALAEEAVLNGAKVLFNTEVTSCDTTKNGYNITLSNNKKISAKHIVNCAAAGYNDVANVLGTENYNITFKRGEYFLLDNTVNITNLTIFPLPSKTSKGVLISPTYDGNTIVGPTSYECEFDTRTTSEGLKEVKDRSQSVITKIPFNKNIRNFSGVRVIVDDDFVIEKSQTKENIINVAGICSPGLSAAPAIAEYVVEELMGYNAQDNSLIRRKPYTSIVNMTPSQRNKLIKSNPDYGQIVCKCECVSLGEIKEALNSPLKPTSVDAVKRRVRAGMGRCQGGFCLTKVIQTISETCKISEMNVVKENLGSNFYVSDINPEK